MSKAHFEKIEKKEFEPPDTQRENIQIEEDRHENTSDKENIKIKKKEQNNSRRQGLPLDVLNEMRIECVNFFVSNNYSKFMVF